MELTLNEVKPLLKYIIKNNEKLQDAGKTPVSVNIIGNAGLGKSEVVKDLATELEYTFVKLNLAQISEMGDIVGYPIKLHNVCKDDDCKWITAELLDAYIKNGYIPTDETKMSYALPEWFKNIDPNKKLILLLDDVTRALNNILQGIYELIYKQETWSFKLPPKSMVIMTSNPDNGDYNVNSVDEAFDTRVMNINIKWDIDSWSKWAEENSVDNRVINFMLSHHYELMKDDETHNHIMNARSYTMFGNVISGIDDWSSPESLNMINMIASGCFNDKDNIIGGLFTSFIANKLDKLISPEDLLMKSWETVKHQVKACVYDGDTYRPAVASILHTRLLNYCMFYFSQKGSKTEVVEDRLLKFIEESKDPKNMLFTEDFFFDIIRNLIKHYPARTNKFMLNRSIREMVK